MSSEAGKSVRSLTERAPGMDRGSSDSCKPRVDLAHLELFRIEPIRDHVLDPRADVRVLLASGLRPGAEHLVVPPYATTILGWARPPSVRAPRITSAGCPRDELLDDDHVLPVIAEVVRVREPVARSGCHVGQSDGSLVPEPELAIGHPEAPNSRLEHVQMRVPPAKGVLDRPVQRTEVQVTGDFQAPPYRRLRAAESDLDLPDAGRGHRCR